MASPLAHLPAGWPGYLVGLLGLVFPFVLNWRRGKIDESAIVLAEWRKLYEAHEKRIEGYEAQIARLTEEFGRHRENAEKEAAALRDRLQKAERRIGELEQIVREKDDLIEGLKRTIIQNSQSTGIMLGRPDMLATSKAIRKETKK